MTVWIVRAGWDYEASRILGVYATEEKAKEKVSQERAEESFDYVDYVDFEVEE